MLKIVEKVVNTQWEKRLTAPLKNIPLTPFNDNSKNKTKQTQTKNPQLYRYRIITYFLQQRQLIFKLNTRKSCRKCGKMGGKLTKSLPFRDNCYHLYISFVERKQHYIFHAKTILHILLFPSSKRRGFVSLKQRSRNEACLEGPGEEGAHAGQSPNLQVSRLLGCTHFSGHRGVSRCFSRSDLEGG